MLMIGWLIVLLILILFWHCQMKRSYFSFSPQSRSVVLIPGLGGSILEAKWDLSFDLERFYCQTKEDHWTQIWPSAFAAVPVENECWKHLIEVGPNFENTKGVEIQAKDWGGLKGINILDEVDLYLLKIPIVKYFEETSKRLKSLGYNVYGAPYDFRRILEPGYLRNFVSRLEQLIEEAGGKVTLISHSLGGPTTTYFLNQQSTKWKKDHIKKFIGLSSPMGGATQALSACLTGLTEGIPVTEAFMKSIEKHYAGILWMINEPKTWRDLPVINGHGSSAIPKFLTLSGEKHTADLWNGYIRDIWSKTVIDPGVEVHLVHGSNVKTLFSLQYPQNGDNYDFRHPFKGYEYEGDGTVPGISLNSPIDIHHWKVKGNTSLPGATHLGILNDKRWLNMIADLV